MPANSIIDLIVLFAFLCFTLAGPILMVVALVLTLRRRSRRIGLSMLLSGIGGFLCVATIAAWRLATRAPVSSQVRWPASFVPLVICGSAGFATFVTVAMLFYFRSRQA